MVIMIFLAVNIKNICIMFRMLTILAERILHIGSFMLFMLFFVVKIENICIMFRMIYSLCGFGMGNLNMSGLL